MKFGFRCTEGGRRFEAAKREVQQAESVGFDSAWVSEHHGWNAKWPNSYVVLAGFAGVTDEITLGTGITILPQTNPVALAGAASLVDVVSDGRFVLGVGTGWRREEMENLGYDFETRGPRMTDHLRALRAIWEDGSTTYEGSFVSIEDFSVAPVPVQDPRPPIWVGGGSEPALKRAARLEDGWLPSWRESFGDLQQKYDRYDELLDEAGADDNSERSRPLLRVTCVDEDGDIARDNLRDLLGKMVQKYRAEGSTVPAAWENAITGDLDSFARDRFVYGTPSECAAQIERYQEAFGTDHVVLKVSTPTTNHEDVMDAVELLGDRLIGAY